MAGAQESRADGGGEGMLIRTTLSAGDGWGGRDAGGLRRIGGGGGVGRSGRWAAGLE